MSKEFHFKKFSLAQVRSLNKLLEVKAVLFQTIQFRHKYTV